MRLDSPFVLASAGTLAIHVLIAVAGDAVVLTHPRRLEPATPRLELVDVEVPAVLAPPPPPVDPPKTLESLPKPTAERVVHHVRTAPRPAAEPPPPAVEPPVSTGGGPVVAIADLGPAATGTVGVAVGPRATGHIGRGGVGTGTGSAVGAGSGELPTPTSVATIKTRALPRGDYYIDPSSYPREAQQLGIEGTLRVRLIVDERGLVKSAQLLNKLGHGLDELALRRASTFEFSPARDTDDRPVASVVVWTFTMALPK